MNSITMNSITVAVTFYLLPACLCAQWLDFKTPGIPRTADGKPDLTAPCAPNSGRQAGPVRALETAAQHLLVGRKPEPLQTIARSRQRQRPCSKSGLPTSPGTGLGRTAYRWVPERYSPACTGLCSRRLSWPCLLMWLAMGAGWTITGRSFSMAVHCRRIRTQRGEGIRSATGTADTLVVETVGFNDRSWLDGWGHPHSEKLLSHRKIPPCRFRAHGFSNHL